MEAPFLALVPAAGKHIGELHLRLGRDRWIHLRGEAGELLHHDLGRRARVLPAEFETGRPALQIAGIDLALGRILEIGLADDEAVGRKLREIAAKNVVEVEPLALPLSPEAFPGKRCIALPRFHRRAPGRPAGIDIFHFRDVDARRLQHRIGNRLPAGTSEHDGLAFEAFDVLRSLALAEGEVEHVGAAHLENGDDRNALRQAEGEHAGRGIAHVGLVLIDELDACRCIRRPRLERRLDVAEIAELLPDPVWIVI